MGQLQDLLERQLSGDIVLERNLPLSRKPEEKGELDTREKSASCKTNLDLSLFLDFSDGRASRKGKWISIDSDGSIRLSSDLVQGRGELTAKVLLNRKGNILVIIPAPMGVVFRSAKGALVGSRKSLMHYLKQKGYKIPLRYPAEWSDEVQGWVGRLSE